MFRTTVNYLLRYNSLILPPDNLYCVEDSKLAHIIYCLMPVVLALWRAIAKTAPKRLPIKGLEAFLANTDFSKKQDHQEIELAQRDV